MPEPDDLPPQPPPPPPPDAMMPPPASAPPPPDASMPPPGQSPAHMAIPLNPRVAIAQLRLALEEGPLARRILRGAMPMALLAALVATLTVSGAIILMLGIDPSAPMGINWAWYITGMAIAVVAGLLQLALFLAGPVWMASWAHRRYFSQDPMLRSSPISGEARARAVLAASVGVVLVATAPTAISTPLTNLMSLFSGTTQAEASLPTVLVALACGAVAALSYAVGLAMYMATGALRALTLDTVTGAARGKGWLSYIGFLGATLGGYILATCLGMLVMVPASVMLGFQAAATAATAPAGTVPRVGTGFFLSTMGAQVLTSLAAVVCLAWIFRWFWQRDLPLVLEMYREQSPGE